MFRLTEIVVAGKRMTGETLYAGDGMTSQDRVRHICLSLPHTGEIAPFGPDPFFTVHGHWFAVHGYTQGVEILSVRVEPELKEMFQADPKFMKAPYLHRTNWVAFILRPDTNWEEVEDLIRGSHQLASRLKPKKPKKIARA